MKILQVAIRLFKIRSSMRRAAIVAAFMATALLPTIALGAAGAGVHIITADASSAFPYAGAVEALADKSMAYWFLALAGLAIGSWTWIVKWLIKQLEDQRAAHANTQNQLINFMEKDHADMRLIMGRNIELIDRLTDKATK
jgi:fructose-specific phosphotransferase system IIC component